jgi:spore photoproduct lyase
LSIELIDVTQESPEKVKAREAAKKAWKTIRAKRMRDRIILTPSLELLSDYGVSQVSDKPAVSEIRTSKGRGIVCQFDKTPATICCGKFWELRWGFGCPFDCNYCYLRGTSRGNMKPRYIRVELVLEALDQVFSDLSFNNGKPAMFNSGELSDSWMNPRIMIQIVDKFEEQHRHKLFTLTKFGRKSEMVQLLLARKRSQTVTAFSINPPAVARLYERAAHPPGERIDAAKCLSNGGYDTRLRIDPIFPIEGWKKHYSDLVSMILSAFTPNRIILGTPRGLWKTIVFAQKAGVDMSWTNYFVGTETGWGKKLPFEKRLEIYRFMFDTLETQGFPVEKVTICKEEMSMWQALGKPVKPLTCNCYGLFGDLA